MENERHGKRVLVVDDDTSIRNLVCSILEQSGYETFQADSKDHTISMVKEHDLTENPIDLLVLDVYMLDGTGFEVMTDLRVMKHVPKIVMMTGSVDQPTVAEIELSHCDGFLAKPFDAAGLLDAVETVMLQE